MIDRKLIKPGAIFTVKPNAEYQPLGNVFEVIHNDGPSVIPNAQIATCNIWYTEQRFCNRCLPDSNRVSIRLYLNDIQVLRADNNRVIM